MQMKPSFKIGASSKLPATQLKIVSAILPATPVPLPTGAVLATAAIALSVNVGPTSRVRLSSALPASVKLIPTESFNETGEWFPTELFVQTEIVESFTLPRSQVWISETVNETGIEEISNDFAKTETGQETAVIVESVLPPSDPLKPTSLELTERWNGTGNFSASESPFVQTAPIKATAGIKPTASLTSSKTFLRSPDLIASDSFLSTAGLPLENKAGAASAGTFEAPMLVGVAAGGLAILVIIALTIWRIRRRKEIELDVEQDEEALTEFTWEAQVDNVFTAEGATYENPAMTSNWDQGHFSRALDLADDDPFTQFE